MKIDGEFFSNLRFADDIFLCTEIPQELRERQVYLQPDGLDSNTYNTYNINIIKYLQYGRHTGTTNICLLPIVQSPWY